MSWLTKLLKLLARGLADLSPRCQEAARLQSAALDRQLTLRRRIGLRTHLLFCGWCRRYGKQIGFLRVAMQRCARDEQPAPPQVLSPEARERIQRRLEADQK